LGQLFQVQQRDPVYTQRVLEPRVMGRGIDQRNQAQLTNLRQAAELGRVDHPLHALGQRHIQLVGNPHQLPSRVQIRDLGKVVDRFHKRTSRQ